MLAVGVAGVGAISHRLVSDASIPHHWSNNERAFFFSLCAYYATCENSAWTGSKVKNKNFKVC